LLLELDKELPEESLLYEESELLEQLFEELLAELDGFRSF
jgi:hypothetical protein